VGAGMAVAFGLLAMVAIPASALAASAVMLDAHPPIGRDFVEESISEVGGAMPSPDAITPATYLFGVGTILLEDMTSGTTQLVGPNQDDTASAVTPIGFDFRFDGVLHSQFSVNANGLARLGPTGISGAFDNAAGFAATTNAPKIAPFFEDLCTGTNGRVHSKVMGTAPNRKLVVEWTGMQITRGTTCAGAGTGTFQMWLFESRGSELPGTIQFVYGPGIGPSAAADGGASIGLQSGAATNFASVTVATGSVSYASHNATNAAGIADGTSYAFTPNVPAAPTGLGFSAVTGTSIQLSWADNASNELGYVVKRSTDGSNFALIAQTAVDATSFIDTSLAPGTLYVYEVAAFTEGAESASATGSQATNPAGNLACDGAGGDWNNGATWVGGSVPTAADNVTISAGCTVTVNVNDAAAFNLLIDAAGTLQSPLTGAVTTFNLTVGGNVVNNGTLDFSTNGDTSGATLTFGAGAANAALSGSGAITDVRGITVAKGLLANTVTLSPDNLSVRGVTTDTAGFLALTSGTLRIAGSFPLTNRVFTVAAYTIAADTALWLDNPNVTVAGQGGSPTVNGLLRISQGTYNVGTGAGNSLGAGVGGRFLIEGGALNLTGRLQTTSSVFYTQTGGTVTTCTLVNTAGTACFGLTGAASELDFAGGTIVLQNPSGNATPLDYSVASTAFFVTNPAQTVLQLGNASAPAAAGYRVLGATPSILVTAGRSLFPGAGATGGTIFMRGATFTNNGIVAIQGTSSRVDFAAAGPMTYTGSGTFGTAVTSFAGSIGSNSQSLTTLMSPIVVNRVNLFIGGFVNSNQITLGNGGTSTTVVQVGSAGLTTAGGSFDVSPVHNQGSGGQIILYSFETVARQTGPEINPTRVLTSLTVANPNGVTLQGGDLALSSTAAALTLTDGRVVTGNAVLSMTSPTATVTRTLGRVDGNLRKRFAAAGSKTFEVGTANGYAPVVSNVTAGTFPADITIRSTQTVAPDFPTPQTAISRHWNIIASDITADLTFSYLDPADLPAGIDEAELEVFRGQAGVYASQGGTINTTANTATVTGVTTFSDWTLAVPSGLLTIVPDSIDFGDVLIGATSGIESVTLGNSGTEALEVTALTAAGGPFAVVASTCGPLPIELAAGASCVVDYSFNPSTAGAALQTLTVTADAPGSGTITLQGNGVAEPTAPEIEVTPASLSATLEPNQSDVRTLTIGNAGGSTLDWTITEEAARSRADAFADQAPRPASTIAANPGIAIAGRGTASGARTLPPVRGNTVVLYDQTDSLTDGINSQDFEAANASFSNQAADDFVVPAADGAWTIHAVHALGEYFNGPGPMPSVNVFFYADAGGLPGAVVSSHAGVTTFLDNAGTLTVDLSSAPVVLPAGTYWVSVQARMDFTPGGQWFWYSRTAQSGAAAAWRNPGNGFNTGCINWGTRGSACGISPGAPDQGFRLDGVIGAGAACVADDMPWLSLSTASGSTAPASNSEVTVTFDATGLAPDTYSGSLCVESNDPLNPVVSVPVSLTVSASSDPEIQVTPTALNFEVERGDTDSGTLTIANIGGGSLVWNIDTDTLPSATRAHDPALNEVLNIPNFASASTANGGTPFVASLPAGVLTSGRVVGFSFQGTVAGISGNSSWASDMCLRVTAPDGSSFDVGGFSATIPGCAVNNWQFNGSGSTNDGTYASTHDNVFPFPPGATDDGNWTFTFINGWNSTSAATMNWSDVTITLHKVPVPVACNDPNLVSWLTVDPASGSTAGGSQSNVDVLIDADGLDAGSYEAFLCVESNDSVGNELVVVPVGLTVTVPTITVDPTSISAAAESGASVNRTLSIGNTGDGTLNWLIEEAPGSSFDPRAHFPRLARNAAGSGGVASMLHEQASLEWLAKHELSIAGPAHEGGPQVPSYSSAGFSRSDYVSLDALVPGVLNSIVNPGPTNIFAAAFLDNDFSRHFFIASSGGTVALNTFGYINTLTGAVTQLGLITGGPAGATTWTTAAWDPTTGTLYAVTNTSGVNQLWTINPANGAASLIGTISGGGLPATPIIIAIAVSGDGLMYGIDISADVLIAIDKTSATPSVIGALGFNANFAQDMDFDRSTGVLYWAGYLGGGNSQIYTVNTATGAATPIGPIADGAELLSFSIAVAGDNCSAPEDVPWLSLDQSSGSIAAGGADDEVDVTLDATGLAIGSYSASLCVRSNDPSRPLVVVPVSFDVTGVPTIELSEVALSASAVRGGAATDSFAVANVGGGSLDWSITEAAAACASPSDVPWLSASPSSGSTSAGGASTVMANFNAANLAVGTHEAVLCIASNDAGNPVLSLPVSFEVTAPVIAVTPTTLPGGTFGAAYSAGVSASGTGSIAPYGFAWSGSIPPGLVLSSSGSISGTPTAAGSFEVTITATDSTDASLGGPFSGQRIYTIVIAQASQTIDFGPLDDQMLSASPITVSATASSTLTVSFASLTASVCTVAGDQVSLLAAGTCTLRASQAGDANYTAAANVDRSFEVLTPVIVVSPGSLPAALIDEPYAVVFSAAGGGAVEPFTFTVSAGALPDGLTLTASGELSGIATDLGTYSFTVTATDATPAGDGGPFSGSREYTLEVIETVIFLDGFEAIDPN
jgi:hypothetical protein